MTRHRQRPTRPRWGRIVAFTVALAIVAFAAGAGIAMWREWSAADAVVAANPSAPSVSPEAPTTSKPPRDKSAKPSPSATPTPDVPALPRDSGSGSRVVFSESEQRVWLVDADNQVIRSYLGSGSIYDNLDPGTYEVYSRSEQAYGIDGSAMNYFVRFTEGNNGGAIGFHTIPTLGGEPVQTLDQLGTPLSHGCIRQDQADALALWDFAQVGTTVVVTA